MHVWCIYTYIDYRAFPWALGIGPCWIGIGFVLRALFYIWCRMGVCVYLYIIIYIYMDSRLGVHVISCRCTMRAPWSGFFENTDGNAAQVLSLPLTTQPSISAGSDSHNSLFLLLDI